LEKKKKTFIVPGSAERRDGIWFAPNSRSSPLIETTGGGRSFRRVFIVPCNSRAAGVPADSGRPFGPFEAVSSCARTLSTILWGRVFSIRHPVRPSGQQAD